MVQFNEIKSSAVGIIDGEKNLIANLANLSSVIFHGLPGVNWVGFYLWSEGDGELVLGPFQGKPACIRIQKGRGVCGQAFDKAQALCVGDVDEFPDHITCDPESRSELVVPLVGAGKVWGVLDMDAPVTNFFGPNHVEFFTSLMDELCPKVFSKD